MTSRHCALRAILQPDLDTAARHYPQVLQWLHDYTAWCDQHGDDELAAHARLAGEVQRLTGKDLARYNVFEWWEEEGIEVLAFRIALPDPPAVVEPALQGDELRAIVDAVLAPESTRLRFPPLPQAFIWHLDTYWHALLAAHCPGYDPRLFHRQRDAGGRWFEYPAQEICARLQAGPV